ncbi:hypothetical protein NC652_026028 [Populus alba x Populus x berolinensis]|nr:hypothetical protein NC652_026028 [Populus alba x Populus x berolinensis]
MEGGAGRNGKEREEEQDGMSVHSPCKAPPSSASSLPKEQSQVELELRLLEALEIYPPLLDRFYNIEMLKPDDEEAEILNHEEDFSLPQSYFVKEE